MYMKNKNFSKLIPGEIGSETYGISYINDIHKYLYKLTYPRVC